MILNRLVSFPLAGLLGVALLSAPPARSADPTDSAAIEKIVRDYLKKHPEVIVEALQEYDRRQQQATAEQQRQTLADERQALVDDPAAPVLGSPDGDVTVVEFFDYRCPYCKSVAHDMLTTLEADGNARIVFKEFPILGPESVYAAQAALAAHQQGKYRDLHLALMGFKGKLDKEAVLKLAKQSGLDIARLEQDMESEAIAQAIERNHDLAQRLQIGGTPAFVIGDQIIPGVIGMDRLKALVAAERKKPS